jgi:serine/threonine protein kinase
MGNEGSSTGTSGEKRVTLAEFEVCGLLGRGGFGKVHLVRHASGELYALKALDKRRVVAEKLVEHTRLERDIMGALQSEPFIVHLHYSFQTKRKLYFVLDYMPGGSLHAHLSGYGGPFEEEVARFYAAEIILALDALHKHDLCYRDLKLENVLLDQEGHVRLTDFGLSAKLQPRGRIHSYSGSPAYLAPEILLCVSTFTRVLLSLCRSFSLSNASVVSLAESLPVYRTGSLTAPDCS